ncbi:MAG: hypothetical protein L3V56_10195 [Candidatus Magnetoovum sp. WYHC-5]|nr:hypothetical protein [Candidatus Magnetoovum sp. WYHC-5]
MKEDKTKEAIFILQVKEYKTKLRQTLKEELVKERAERHARGEIFCYNTWIPREKIQFIRKRLFLKGMAIFFELHVLFFLVMFIIYVIWNIFKRFILI